MTPEESKEWFEKHKVMCAIEYKWDTFTSGWSTIYKDVLSEDMYQAFKTRLIEETTCCELPKEPK